jgi:DNA helicase-2/ATP-dependent DNA helicase PcrA
METRVDLLVPYGFVGATIATFHAFCDRLVREHAVELGLTSQLRVETPAEILVFLRERLFELGSSATFRSAIPTRTCAHWSACSTARATRTSRRAVPEVRRVAARDAGDDPERLDRATAEIEKARAYGVYQRLLLEHGAGRLRRADRTSRCGCCASDRTWRASTRTASVTCWSTSSRTPTTSSSSWCGCWSDSVPTSPWSVTTTRASYRFRGAKVENLLGFLDAFPGARTLVLKQTTARGSASLDVAHRPDLVQNPQRMEHQRGLGQAAAGQRVDPATRASARGRRP